LNQYFQKFNKRLKAKNLLYVKQLLYVLRNLLTVFASGSTKNPVGKFYKACHEVGSKKIILPVF